MADTLLGTGTRLADIADDLTAWLPGDATAYSDRPDPTGSTPFVVLVAALTPTKVGLSGRWSMATMTLAAHSVHDSPAEARALGDLVRTWVLTLMAIPGQIDVEPADAWLADDPGGVHQGREAWSVTLVRS